MAWQHHRGRRSAHRNGCRRRPRPRRRCACAQSTRDGPEGLSVLRPDRMARWHGLRGANGRACHHREAQRPIRWRDRDGLRRGDHRERNADWRRTPDARRRWPRAAPGLRRALHGAGRQEAAAQAGAAVDLAPQRTGDHRPRHRARLAMTDDPGELPFPDVHEPALREGVPGKPVWRVGRRCLPAATARCPPSCSAIAGAPTAVRTLGRDLGPIRSRRMALQPRGRAVPRSWWCGCGTPCPRLHR